MRWARTTPATELRSQSPRPSSPICAACSISSSACEAPRRNEKLEAAANSVYRGMSRIHPVEKPARRRHVAVEPGAKEPEAQPRLVLDAEIVARGATLFAPPGAFDAFGSFRANHFVQGAAPAEAHRRAVRHEGEDVGDGFGLGEQAQRTRAQLSVGAEAAERIPAKLGARHGLRRHRRGGEFGDMAVTSDETRNPPPSEPRAQAIDQAIELGLIFTH